MHKIGAMKFALIEFSSVERVSNSPANEPSSAGRSGIVAFGSEGDPVGSIRPPEVVCQQFQGEQQFPARRVLKFHCAVFGSARENFAVR